MTAETIVTALGGHKAGNSWTTRCPAHDNHHPSLSIRDGDAFPATHLLHVFPSSSIISRTELAKGTAV